jgi:hypothetical protein
MGTARLEENSMWKFNAIKPALTLALAACLLPFIRASAQDTNNVNGVWPQTRLEAFATNTGTVIIKSTAEIGAIAASAGNVSVKCKEIDDTGTGRKEFGLAIDLTPNNQSRDARLIDYEEVDPLLNAVDYINKVDWSASSLNSFDAVYTTKGGFRIAAFSSKRSGFIEYSVRGASEGSIPILLSRNDLASFRNLLQQAKTKLDSLRGK